MSDPLADAADAISTASPNIRAFAQLSAARTIALEARVAALEKPPPPPPPPPPPLPWTWDARAAKIASDSAAKIAGWIGYMGAVYFATDVAVAYGDASSPVTTISGPGLDHSAHVPAGTRRGCTNDHHLVIVDSASGREHDLYGAAFTSTGWTAAGGASFPIGTVVEPGPSSSNAAAMAMRPTAITPAEIAAGTIPHALTFYADAPHIGGPVVYPARVGGTPGPGNGITFGQWLRLDPAVDVSAIPDLTNFERIVCRALQRFGMFLRDGAVGISGIYGVDTINQGGNDKTYPSVGLSLPNLATGVPGYPSGYPYARIFSPVMPWKSMQVLQPPTP